MREYLRRQADAGWIIDLTPEGHQPSIRTRLFPKVAQPLCVAVFARYGAKNAECPATVRFTTVGGTASDKLEQLGRVEPLQELNWRDCADGWLDPFIPVAEGEHLKYLELSDVFAWSSRGITAGRSWVYAPEQSILYRCWEKLIAAEGDAREELLAKSRDRHLDSRVDPLPGQDAHSGALREESGPPVEPVRVAYRAFDRQWLIPDNRLLSVPRPALWRVQSDNQIFISEQHTQPITEGPGALFESRLPDLDHFMGHHGGRVFPLYLDAAGRVPNLAPGLLTFLKARINDLLSAEDVVAYLAALVGHGRYRRQVYASPPILGLRLPLSASSHIWKDAIALGKRVLWLHSCGERSVDTSAGRPAGPPRPLGSRGPQVLETIPYEDGQLPDRMTFDIETMRVRVGDGAIGPVSLAAWNYRVGGVRTLDKWFRYRQKSPKSRRSSALNDIVGERWSSRLTVDLINLLNILEGLVEIEAKQSDLLGQVMAGEIIDRGMLIEAGVLPVAPNARRPQTEDQQDGLFES